ncbi:MAG: hypothetical protein F4X11_07105 [Acidobacteria bacterium]|nr:hypothetical protein [Acidobacteriota bacterium]
MRQRHILFGVAFAVVVAAMTMAPVSVSGQSADDGSAPRTPWGHPDLQGYWTSSTYTPLQRPESLGDQAFLSEEELAAANEILTAEGVDPLRARSYLAGATEEERLERTQQTQENIHYDNSIWLRENQPRRLAMRRTSLIVDPPNGRIPPLIPSAREREALRRAESRWLTTNISPQSFDSHETRTLQERCLVWRHEGPPMLPPSYNDLMQILQTEHYVVVMQEMRENDARIIPLDGRPHLPGSMREWSGDSRGRWEGDTLVVESINFNDKVHFNGSSTGLHVVERFTRVDDENIRYEFTVTDPTTWVQPWSVEYPLMQRDGPLYEYACHEGNYDARHILEVARNLDKAAAADGEESR